MCTCLGLNSVGGDDSVAQVHPANGVQGRVQRVRVQQTALEACYDRNLGQKHFCIWKAFWRLGSGAKTFLHLVISHALVTTSIYHDAGHLRRRAIVQGCDGELPNVAAASLWDGRSGLRERERERERGMEGGRGGGERERESGSRRPKHQSLLRARTCACRPPLNSNSWSG